MPAVPGPTPVHRAPSGVGEGDSVVGHDQVTNEAAAVVPIDAAPAQAAPLLEVWKAPLGGSPAPRVAREVPKVARGGPTPPPRRGLAGLGGGGAGAPGSHAALSPYSSSGSGDTGGRAAGRRPPPRSSTATEGIGGAGPSRPPNIGAAAAASETVPPPTGMGRPPSRAKRAAHAAGRLVRRHHRRHRDQLRTTAARCFRVGGRREWEGTVVGSAQGDSCGGGRRSPGMVHHRRGGDTDVGRAAVVDRVHWPRHPDQTSVDGRGYTLLGAWRVGRRRTHRLLHWQGNRRVDSMGSRRRSVDAFWGVQDGLRWTSRWPMLDEDRTNRVHRRQSRGFWAVA